MSSETAPAPIYGEGGGKGDGGGGEEVDAAKLQALDLPLLLTATVVKGFGRGSKLLGIPTANLDMEQVGAMVDYWPNGIYFGFVFLRDQIYKAVASIGTNPYFKNSQKTVEPHLLYEFPDDFYGEELKFLVCGYVRPEASFPSLDELVKAIRNDIAFARAALEEPEWKKFSSNNLGWTKSVAC
ncbi:riboflavin kinase [Nannochloropsis oceanica]